MIYFSAHWCPPCRGFTPELVKVYNKMKESRDDFELVFASSDKDEGAFKEYFGEMPWLALPYENREAKNSLSKIFEVEGIPSLVVLGPSIDGKREVINAAARGAASLDNIADFPWRPKPYSELSSTVECNGSDINESTAVIVLCEAADDDEQKEIKDAVKGVAEKQKALGSDLLFFYGTSSSGAVPRVRELCKIPESKFETVMIILDIPDNGGYYVSDCTDITAENIEKFIADKKDRKQLA
jgi:nucleoredoxin